MLSFSGPCLIFSVGGIVCGEDPFSSQAATMDSPQNESRGENGTPAYLSLSATALFTTKFSDHRTPASTSASGAIHFSLPMTTQCDTACELDYRFAGGNIPHEHIPKVLPCMFDARDYQDCIRQLPEQDLKMWADRSDQVLNP